MGGQIDGRGSEGRPQAWSRRRPTTGTRLVWNDWNGETALWMLDASTTLTGCVNFPAQNGFTVSDVSVDAANNAWLLWTDPDGAAGLWSVDANCQATYGLSAGPYEGWTPSAITTGAGGTNRLLWSDSVTGAQGIWIVGTGSDTPAAFVYGPY